MLPATTKADSSFLRILVHSPLWSCTLSSFCLLVAVWHTSAWLVDKPSLIGSWQFGAYSLTVYWPKAWQNYLQVHAMGKDSGGCAFDFKGLVNPVKLNGKPCFHLHRVVNRSIVSLSEAAKKLSWISVMLLHVYSISNDLEALHSGSKSALEPSLLLCKCLESQNFSGWAWA